MRLNLVVTVIIFISHVLEAMSSDTLIIYMNYFSPMVPYVMLGHCRLVGNEVHLIPSELADYEKVTAALSRNPYCIFVQRRRSRISFACRWNGKALEGDYTSYRRCGRVKISGTFRDGKFVGERFKFNRKGRLKQRRYYPA